MSYSANAIITLLVAKNPKHEFGKDLRPNKAFQRFALYRNGMSVGQYKALVLTHPAGGKTYAATDLIWDTQHKFIAIAEPAVTAEPAADLTPTETQPEPVTTEVTVQKLPTRKARGIK